MSLRQRQIREVLDEDLKYNREVLNREMRQAKLMNETYAPPNRFEKRVAFQIDQYFLKLQRHTDDVINRLISGDGSEHSGVRDMLYSYQELVIYLDTYASHAPLTQRDIAIIENKFDGIAPQVEQISNYADALGWRGAGLIETLSEMLQYRTYLPLQGLSQSKIVSKEMMERGFTDPMIGIAPIRQQGFNMDDMNINYDEEEDEDDDEVREFEEVEERVDGLERIEPEGAIRRKFEKPEGEVIPRPRTRGEAQKYISKIPMKEFRALAKELGFLDKLNAKKTTSGLKQRPTLEQMLQIYILREQGIRTMEREEMEGIPEPEPEPEPETETETETETEEDEEEEEEEEEEVEGSGFMSKFMKDVKRKRDKNYKPTMTDKILHSHYGVKDDFLQKKGKGVSGLGIKLGAGESEDMMFGAPAGQKKALKLRPMDRQPVTFKTQDERGQMGLSLSDRMMFLNDLETNPVKEEIQINSTGTYKKNMSEKIKKLNKK